MLHRIQGSGEAGLIQGKAKFLDQTDLGYLRSKRGEISDGDGGLTITPRREFPKSANDGAHGCLHPSDFPGGCRT